MSQQIDEIAESSRAPIEVLIEEVRQQTRRRRRRNVALALLALVLGATVYLVTSRSNGAPSASNTRPTSAMPAAVASAIKKTLSVRSVEVLVSYEPDPGIYQAPNLYSTWEHGGKATIVPVFITVKPSTARTRA